MKKRPEAKSEMGHPAFYKVYVKWGKLDQRLRSYNRIGEQTRPVIFKVYDQFRN